MTEQKTNKQTLQINRLGHSCLSFRFKNLFITDNRILFIAPNDKFCHLCFQRRYLAQIPNPVEIKHLHKNVIPLATKLEESNKINERWHAYSVAEKQYVMAFDLIQYEDCPSCSTVNSYNATDAHTEYEKLLNKKSQPNLVDLRSQIFSFGFARGGNTTKTIGLPISKFDKIYGDCHEAKIFFRMIAADGRHADGNAIGFDRDKALADLKSMMEYLERYAFMMHLCRYRTTQFDDKIIDENLKLFRKTATKKEKKLIRQQATWGLNLSTTEVRAIPLSFIFDKGEVSFIKPTSNGFGAHIWHDPQRAFHFEPDNKYISIIDELTTIIRPVVDNETLTGKFFILKSPLSLPVILITIHSKKIDRPPSLCFGSGVGFDLAQAIDGAIDELRQNVANLVKGVTVIEGFLSRKFTDKIEGIPDRMNYYSTSTPGGKLKFLDNNNPLIDGVYEDMKRFDITALVERFEDVNYEIYGIDCTPLCFSNKNIYVTRAFSPQLYPIQFEQEDVFKISTGPLSACKELPHFFL